jgi:hypothetical protein
MPDERSHFTKPPQEGSSPSKVSSKPPSRGQDSQKLPSRYSIGHFSHSANPYEIYTFQVGTTGSLLRSSCADGETYFPKVEEYTGPTVVTGDTLVPGTAVTYGADKDGVMHWQGEDTFDEDNITRTGSEKKGEEYKST